MDTGGFKIVRFRGRYFVYHENWEGYPRGLGETLVKQIPTNPVIYKEWLEEQRAIYAGMTAELEGKVLTVTQDTLDSYGSADEDYASWHMIDDRLVELPSAILSKGTDPRVEWTYTLDLDREKFLLNNWIHFELSNFPHGSWQEALSKTYDGTENSSFKVYPKGTSSLLDTDFLANKHERERYHAKYETYKIIDVKTNYTSELPSKYGPGQILATLIFEQFIEAEGHNLEQYLPGWTQDDFAFRELAYAILSFAAGHFRFLDSARLGGEETNGYRIDQDTEVQGCKLQLLPLFASGCHMPRREAGSAPQTSMYWFENVLVSLAPESALDDHKAAIAHVVEYGIGEDKVHFHTIVFSVVSVIMLEVSVENDVTTVRRTAAIKLYTTIGDNSGLGELEELRSKHSGFVKLSHFLDTASHRHVSLFSQGSFPTEIYENILASVPNPTYSTSCSLVSPAFRSYCKENFLFSSNLVLKDINIENTQPEAKKRVKRQWTFLLLERSTGRIIKSERSQAGHGYYKREGDRPLIWSVVIGSAQRSSLLSRVNLYPKIPGEAQRRNELQTRAPFLANFAPMRYSPNRDAPIWDMSPTAIALEFENLWMPYLLDIFCTRRPGHRMSAECVRFPFSLRPHYRETSIVVGSRPARTMWVCTRRTADGDTAERRDETCKCIGERLAGRAGGGDVLVVAHGFCVAYFEWMRKNDGAAEDEAGVRKAEDVDAKGEGSVKKEDSVIKKDDSSVAKQGHHVDGDTNRPEKVKMVLRVEHKDYRIAEIRENFEKQYLMPSEEDMA